MTSKGDEFQTDTYFPANPADVDQSDHTALLHLSDATLLHNTRMRYLRDDIYTYVGPILVSVNPFKYIPKLYAPELMADCKRFPPGHPQRPPHTFSMAEAAYMQAGGKYGHSRCGHSKCTVTVSIAYMQMRKRGSHQSLVVSGESGAGKTEVNKQCMNYLVRRTPYHLPRLPLPTPPAPTCPTCPYLPHLPLPTRCGAPPLMTMRTCLRASSSPTRYWRPLVTPRPCATTTRPAALLYLPSTY